MAPSAAEIQVTFDCSDPHAQARWWANLLGYEVQDAHDFVTGLLEQGVVGTDDVVEIDGRRAFADGAAAFDPKSAGPRLYFQLVPEGKVAKNRVHLDVAIGPAEPDTEVERVTALGAVFVESQSQGGHRWAVMRDPEGNEFCLH